VNIVAVKSRNIGILLEIFSRKVHSSSTSHGHCDVGFVAHFSPKSMDFGPSTDLLSIYKYWSILYPKTQLHNIFSPPLVSFLILLSILG